MERTRHSCGRRARSVPRSTSRNWMPFTGEEYDKSFEELLRSLRPTYRYRTRNVEPMDISDDNEGLPEPDKADLETIKVASVDFNISKNTIAHKTDEYDITEERSGTKPSLVVRRGQSFTITLEFDRDYVEAKDDLNLIFQFGTFPHPSKRTYVQFKLSGQDLLNQWGAKITKKDGKKVTIEVFTPPTLYVGKWSFKVDAIKKKESGTTVFQYDNKDFIYILFNPWNKDDQVYHPDSKLLEEYVLTDVGKIYMGNFKRPFGKNWFFGQFQSIVLDCALYILDHSGLGITARGDPIKVSRAITKMVNAPNDNGILVGNWSGNYEGGTPPTKWTGSVTILEQFYNTKSPVCYGQCWVFSGITTTVCRALGLPTRSVTNFISAHDTDGSVTIDYYFNEDGDKVAHSLSDSIWNFHVWNDTWMARPDLPSGYGGWQAIDATPQETSDGVYCMGPVSLKAIRNGDLYLPYDAPFCFGEVNGDLVQWMVSGSDSNEVFEVIRVFERRVGKMILTKKPDTIEERDRPKWKPVQENVTREYKYEEGSEEERQAIKRSRLARGPLFDISSKRHDTKEKDLDIQLVDLEDCMIGKEFSVTIKVTNKAKEDRTVAGNLKCSSMYYTGISYALIKKVGSEVVLKPGKSDILTMKVTPKDYLSKLKDHAILRLSYGLRVKETNHCYIDDDEFSLLKPDLTIKAPEEVKVDQLFKVQVSFENPLSQTLTDCSLMIEGGSLKGPKEVELDDFGANSTVVAEFSLKPVKRTGGAIKRRFYSVNFNCKEMSGVNGLFSVKVNKPMSVSPTQP